MSHLRNLLNRYGTAEVPDLFYQGMVQLVGEVPVRIDDPSAHIWIDAAMQGCVKRMGIVLEYLGQSEISYQGKLALENQTFHLKLSNDLSGTQRRYVLAHELGHLMSYESTPEGPVRWVEHTLEEERFCDELAREILIPQVAVQDFNISMQDLEKTETWHRLKRVTHGFRVSLWNLMRRLFRDNLNTLVLLDWEWDKERNTLVLVGKYAPWGVFVPTGKTTRSASTTNSQDVLSFIGETFASQKLMHGHVDYNFGSLTGNMLTVACPYSSQSANYRASKVLQVLVLRDDLVRDAEDWRRVRAKDAVGV